MTSIATFSSSNDIYSGPVGDVDRLRFSTEEIFFFSDWISGVSAAASAAAVDNTNIFDITVPPANQLTNEIHHYRDYLSPEELYYANHALTSCDSPMKIKNEHIEIKSIYNSVSLQIPPVRLTTTRTAKKEIQLCTYVNCTNRARSRGLCKRHGGGKRCTEVGCNRPAQCKGKCPKHGGATRCKVENCLKFAQSQGRCKAHGGGTQCASIGCKKNAHQNRFCRTHGGGLRCTHYGCTKWAQKSGFCCAHTKLRSTSSDFSFILNN